jgi:hypothetical protein
MTNTSPDIQDLSKAGIQAILTGIAVNAVLACVKSLGGVAGNSYALVADGIESAADIASSLIVLGGLKIATLPPVSTAELYMRMPCIIAVICSLHWQRFWESLLPYGAANSMPQQNRCSTLSFRRLDTH